MKRSSQHAFEPEEIMAYLDGELPANEAATLAGHLEHCADCQAIATQLRQVSERMLEFQVEPCRAKVGAVIQKADGARTDAPGTRAAAVRRPRRLLWRVLAWAGGAAALVLLVWLSIPNLLRTKGFSEYQAQRVTGLSASDKKFSQLQAYAKLEPAPSNGGAIRGFTAAAGRSRAGGGGGGDDLSQDGNEATVPTRMIERTASITVVASNYDQASKAVEQITTSHGGYVQDMNADTQTGTARSLSATLRVPEKQLESLLADLGRFGHIEQESRSNQEITDQYIDLTARLRNARAEERRILEILKTRTGKLSDVLAAERELARVGGEIESMEGQRTYMEHEVSYATVQVQLNEVYRAQLNPGASSTSTRIRNSLVEGFRNLSDSLASLVIFIFAYGPAILLWVALIGLPAWFGWRRFRRGRDRGAVLPDLKPR